ncbi:MAG: hypothetical protein EOP09_15655, partial [Proteobacteria bacterium]
MSVTASRIGSSSLLIEWSGLPRPARSDSHQGKDKFKAPWESLKNRFANQEVAFYNAPIDEKVSCLSATIELASQVRKSGKFKTALFLGIGGSSLGPMSLLSALKHKANSGIDCLFMENPDPEDWVYTLKKFDPATTLIVPIAKSGTTFETLAQFLLALEWLGEARWKEHVIAITDPVKGDLRKFANEAGIRTLPIFPGVGGRFSLFTPVGLFPAAIAGLDPEALMNGAKKCRDYCEKTPIEKNPLFLIGADLLAQFKERPIHVAMPYSTELKLFGSWFVQLWAESLGKDGKGFTPLAALGAVDQHSLLQLLRDGPDDKVVFFLRVTDTENKVTIPSLKKLATGSLASISLPAFDILSGTSLHDLLTIEYQAIAKVLTNRARPHFLFQLDKLNEESLGTLTFA